MHRRLDRTPSDVAASKRTRRVRGKKPDESDSKVPPTKRPATRTQETPVKTTDEEKGGETQQNVTDDEKRSLQTSDISISTSRSDSSSSSSSSTSNDEASVRDADADVPAVEAPSNNEVVPEGTEVNQSQATQNTEPILSDPWMASHVV